MGKKENMTFLFSFSFFRPVPASSSYKRKPLIHLILDDECDKCSREERTLPLSPARQTVSDISRGAERTVSVTACDPTTP